MRGLLAVLLLAAHSSVSLATGADPPAGAHRASRSSCGWTRGFHSQDLDGTVNALVDCSDGRGPALCVGGLFGTAGGKVVNNVARWDGAGWSALGDPSNPGVLYGSVHALAVYDDGNGPGLYVGGSFQSPGTPTGRYLARWEESGWHALPGPDGGELTGSVRAFAVFDDGRGPALFVAGSFARVGTLTVNYIARWDGSSWSALDGPAGTGVSGSVLALVVHDDGSGPALYAGGTFATAGGVPTGRVARWDGTGWSWLANPPGLGLNDTVRALASFDDGRGAHLYAGGSFTDAAGEAVQYVARWDGESWSALPPLWSSGAQPWITALAVGPDGDFESLYVGWSTNAYAASQSTVSKWTGINWSPVTGTQDLSLRESVRSLVVFDDGQGPSLYVGGVMGNTPYSVGRGIARLDGQRWSPLSPPAGAGLSGPVRALAAYESPDGPRLVAGGEFVWAGGQEVNWIAAWDGATWSPLTGPEESGVSSWVRAVATYDDGLGSKLYAGGYFGSAGGEWVGHVAQWNGHSWSALRGTTGAGTSGNVYALQGGEVGGARVLFVGGYFTSAGGSEVNHVARWGGGSWAPLQGYWDTGVSTTVRAFAVFDDGSGPALYAGGDFREAGGRPAHSIARWRDGDWSALGDITGEGLSDAVYALAVFDDGSGPALFAGGKFLRAGTLEVNHVARWDGSSWSALEGPSSAGVDGHANALAVFDDGSGPALYVGGGFYSAGGVPVVGIARWDGSSWSSLGPEAETGLDGSVYALTVVDLGGGPMLVAGGDFTIAGHTPSLRIGAWRCVIEVEAPADSRSTGLEVVRHSTPR